MWHYTLDKRVANPFKYITYLIICLGLPANIALFRTYQQKDLEFRFNIFILLISFFDFSYLIVEIVATALDYGFNTMLEFINLKNPNYFRFCDNNYCEIWGFFLFFTFGGSAYTTALMATERYMTMYRGWDTNKIPIGWTILSIIGWVGLINIHNFIHFEANMTMDG